MSLHFFKTVQRTIKHWYLPLLAGIVLIALGIWTFKEPVDSYVALAFLFSLGFVLSGLFESIFSIVNRDVIDSWGWHLAMGIITLIVGVLMFMNPEITMLTLPFYVGFVILFRSMNAIGVALDLKSYGILDWGNIMAVGIVGIFLAFVLLWNPLFAGLSIVIWTGIALVIAGILNIMISFKLKKIHDIPKTISKDLKREFNEGLKKKYNEFKTHIEDLASDEQE